MNTLWISACCLTMTVISFRLGMWWGRLAERRSAHTIRAIGYRGYWLRIRYNKGYRFQIRDRNGKFSMDSPPYEDSSQGFDSAIREGHEWIDHFVDIDNRYNLLIQKNKM